MKEEKLILLTNFFSTVLGTYNRKRKTMLFNNADKILTALQEKVLTT